MEVTFSFTVSDLVEHDLALDSDARRFTNEDALQSLQHLKDVHWIHTTILIMVAKLEHELDFLVLGHS